MGTVGAGIYYLLEKPRQWDRDIAAFLAKEYVEAHPEANDKEVMNYIQSEKIKFYSANCGVCNRDYAY
jgi:hypothetical protein